MASPLSGSVLTGPSLTFSWSAGCGLNRYDLWLGTAPETANLYDAADGNFLSRSVSGLPTDGSTIYFRLTSSQQGFGEAWFQKGSFTAYSQPLSQETQNACLGGRWATFFKGDPAPWAQVFANQTACVQFFQSNPCQAPAVMQSPIPGSVLPGSTVTFTWSAGCGLNRYDLWLGTTPVSGNLFDASDGNFLSQTASGLPTGGSPVYFVITSSLQGSGESWRQQGSFTSSAPLTATTEALLSRLRSWVWVFVYRGAR